MLSVELASLEMILYNDGPWGAVRSVEGPFWFSGAVHRCVCLLFPECAMEKGQMGQFCGVKQAGVSTEGRGKVLCNLTTSHVG